MQKQNPFEGLSTWAYFIFLFEWYLCLLALLWPPPQVAMILNKTFTWKQHLFWLSHKLGSIFHKK